MAEQTPLSPAWIATLIVVLGGAGGLFWWTSRDRGFEDVPPPPKELEVREDTYALLVGCTDYPVLEALYKDRPIHYRQKIYLEGPANDVELMQVTLHQYLGVPEANITVMTGWSEEDIASRPTRDNVLGWLDDRATKVKPGDRVIFHFSGHGSQVNDTDDSSTESEPDGYDEVLLTADVDRFSRSSKHGYGGAITDDELRRRLQAMRKAGATVWASIDCCHAGSMSRGVDNTRVRRIEPSELGAPEPARSRGSVELEIDPDGQALGTDDGIVAFYSVQSHQEAPERKLPPTLEPSERRYHGVFTYLLARTLQRYGGAITFAELQAHLVAAYQTLPCDSVAPYAEGALDMRVARDGKASGPPLLLRKEGETFLLNAGSVRGFAKGAELHVFARNRDDDGEQPLGTVKILSAGFVQSTCTPVGDSALTDGTELPARMPARVSKVSEAGFRLYLVVTDGQGGPLEADAYPAALQRFLADPQDAGRLAIVPAVDADWALRVEPDRLRLELLEAGDETAFFDVPAERLDAQLRALVKAQNLRRIVHGDAVAPLPEGLRIRLERNGAPFDSGATLHPGDELMIFVSNKTDKDWALTLPLVDANHGVSVLWPDRGAEKPAIITADAFEEQSIGPFDMQDDAIGSECLLVLATPTGPGATPFYFWDLASEALTTSRGSEGAPASAEPFYRLAFGERTRSRGLAPDPKELGVGQISWHTRWGRLGLPDGIRAEGVETPADLRGFVDKQQGDDASAPPSPWYVGRHAAAMPGGPKQENDTEGLIKTGEADAFVTWDNGVLQIYIDTDGDAGIGTEKPAALLARIVEKTLDVELIVRIEPGEPGRHVAWYTPEGSQRSFTRALVDDDEDRRADRRYEWDGGSWKREPSDAHWLATEHMDWDWAWVDAAGEEGDRLMRLRTIRALARFIQRSERR